MLTLQAVEGSWPWGTLRSEHRWNPELILEISRALDRLEADPDVEVLLVTNEGKFWSNGMDLRYLDLFWDPQLQKDCNQLMSRLES